MSVAEEKELSEIREPEEFRFWLTYEPKKEDDFLEALEYVMYAIDEATDAIVAEAKRLGCSFDRWDYNDFTWDRVFEFWHSSDAAAFFQLAGGKEHELEYEEGSCCVYVPRKHLTGVRWHLSKQPTPDFPALRLEAFHDFASNLHDVEEEGEDVDWQNRLGWAWSKLNELSKLLGPEYEQVVSYYYSED